MNIQDECFNFCKQIWKLSYRAEVIALIHSLGQRSGFGELMQSFVGHQFLTPLYIHYNQSNFIDKTSGIRLSTLLHQLSEKELYLFLKCHFFLNFINEQCVQKIVEKFPELKPSLNPYDRFMSLEVPNLSINDCIEPRLIEPLVESFCQHEACQKILNEIPENLVRLNASQLPENIKIFFGGLYNSITDMPSWVQNIPEKNTDEYWLYCLTRCAVCINSILRNIDQLIYQAFLRKQLVVFNEDNIIYIGKHQSNSVCQDVELTIQGQQETIHCVPFDIVLMNYMNRKREVKYFANITTTGLSIGIGNQGMTQKFDLRVIDESLNPYPNFVTISR